MLHGQGFIQGFIRFVVGLRFGYGFDASDQYKICNDTGSFTIFLTAGTPC